MKKRVKLFSRFFFEFAVRFREETEDQFYFDFRENKIYAHVSFDDCEIFKKYSIRMSKIPRDVLKEKFNLIPFFYVYEDDCIHEYLKLVKVDVEALEEYTNDWNPNIKNKFIGYPDAYFRDTFYIYESDHPCKLKSTGYEWYDFYGRKQTEAAQKWLDDNPEVKTRRKIIYEQPSEKLVKKIALTVYPDIDVENMSYVPVDNYFQTDCLYPPSRCWGE